MYFCIIKHKQILFMKKTYTLFPFLSFILLSWQLHSQTPANDTCSGAEVLPVDTSCNYVVANTQSATDSGVPSPGCGSYQGADLWYTFTVPNITSTESIILSTSAIAGSNVNDTGMALYSGDCNNLTLVECDDSDSPGNFSRIVLKYPSPGSVYYVRVWVYDNDYADAFNLCAKIEDIPANDLCSGAEPITVYPPGGGAGNEISAHTLTATFSGQYSSCDSYGQNLDLWYSFTAPPSGKIKVITGGDEGRNIEAAVYDSCGGTELECHGNSNIKTFSGLTPGQSYLLQVWHDTSHVGDFTLVIEDVGFSNIVFDTDIMPNCSQNQFSVNVNVTDLGGAQSVTISDDQGNPSQQLTSTGTVTFGPYNSGDTVVFTVTNDADNSFTTSQTVHYICPPENDDCANAIEVTYPLPYTNTQDATGATNNSGFISCNGNGMNDGVWYKFTAETVNGDLTIEVRPQGWDAEVAVYTGNCNNLNCVSRADVGGTNVRETINFTPVSGTDYYINIGYWSDSNDGNEGPFTITVSGDITGVDKLNKNDFKFYPNPSKSIIYWDSNRPVEKIQITNLSGQIIMTLKKPVTPYFNISNLNKGIYFINVFIDGKQATYKIIKI